MSLKHVLLIALTMMLAGCKLLRGPDRTGEFRLSSEKFLAESYYLFGYSYEDSEFYRYPYKQDPIPDIINEGFRVIEEGGQYELPGFNTPGQMNGFALLGTFESLADARTLYNDYKKVGDDLQFVTVSDTVKQYQVWVQQTVVGNYVKLLVKEVKSLEGEEGNKYSEALIEYTYQPNGSKDFPD
jgi:hypothetical protein